MQLPYTLFVMSCTVLQSIRLPINQLTDTVDKRAACVLQHAEYRVSSVDVFAAGATVVHTCCRKEQ